MIKIAITKGRIQKQVTNLLENANYDVEPILNLGRELQIKRKMIYKSFLEKLMMSLLF